MACASAVPAVPAPSPLSPNVRGAFPAPARPGGPDTARRDRLACLLAISLLLHLALLAWPASRHAFAGPSTFVTHHPYLSARLAAPAATPDSAARAAAGARHVMQPRGAAPRAAAADFAPPSILAAPQPHPVLAPDLPSAPVGTPYYPAEQLTTRPRALAEPELDPQQLADIVASGEVALTLWIDEYGQVAELQVEDSNLPDVFAQTAAAAFREMRFAPGELDGHAVGSVLRIAVRYDDERLADENDASRERAVEPAT